MQRLLILTIAVFLTASAIVVDAQFKLYPR
jgi:hypothetical protein